MEDGSIWRNGQPIKLYIQLRDKKSFVEYCNCIKCLHTVEQRLFIYANQQRFTPRQLEQPGGGLSAFQFMHALLCTVQYDIT